MVIKTYPHFFNSRNAEYINPEKNQFSVRLSTPISIPIEAKNCEIALHSAVLFNNSPNIFVGHNKLYLTYNGVQRVLIFPQGLYSIIELSETLVTLLIQSSFPDDLINITSNDATSQLIIHFNYLETTIDWTPGDTIRHILGFTSRISPIGPVDVLLKIDVNDTTTEFNANNIYYILCPSLVNDGIYLNDIGASILGRIPISGLTNDIVSFEASHPIYICCDHLVGKKIFDLQFKLTNQNLENLLILEDYSFCILIQYQL
jgi:hypothetical protein